MISAVIAGVVAIAVRLWQVQLSKKCHLEVKISPFKKIIFRDRWTSPD
ncbi:hypothetical protein Lepto7375DRAFT_1253 [Leptolyngbya sp. PCC 7375]|nr:hypothetical protein Lepto7375DRAFT_1253 [Leptolyngbya sp. PCC 7375]